MLRLSWSEIQSNWQRLLAWSPSGDGGGLRIQTRGVQANGKGATVKPEIRKPETGNENDRRIHLKAHIHPKCIALRAREI